MKMINMKKKTVVAVLLMFAVAAAGLLLVKAPKKATAPAPAPAVVETARAAYGDPIEEGFETTASLKSLEEVEVNAKVTARVKAVMIKRGDRIRAGETLLTLDGGAAAAEYATQQAQIQVAEAELEQTKAQLGDARREYERYGRLLRDGYATRQEYDKRVTELAASKADCARAEASLKEARSVLTERGVSLSEYRLTAPISGVVLEDYDMTPGTMLAVGTNVARIGAVDTLRAVVEVPETKASGIKQGISASIVCEGAGGGKYKGKVSVVNQYVDDSTRTVKVEVLVDNRAVGYLMKPGMFASVRFVQRREEHPLVIPAEAIGSDGSVKIVEHGRIRSARVETGASQNGKTSVISGLTEGTFVVVSGGKSLKDGEAVIISN